MGCNCQRSKQAREDERRKLAEQRRIQREQALAKRQAYKTAKVEK